jgi:hypothetical protein
LNHKKFSRELRDADRADLPLDYRLPTFCIIKGKYPGEICIGAQYWTIEQRKRGWTVSFEKPSGALYQYGEILF